MPHGVQSAENKWLPRSLDEQAPAVSLGAVWDELLFLLAKTMLTDEEPPIGYDDEPNKTSNQLHVTPQGLCECDWWKPAPENE